MSMAIVSHLQVQRGALHEAAGCRRQEGGVSGPRALVAIWRTKNEVRWKKSSGHGARSEFRLAETLWMDVLKTSLSGMGMLTS